MRVRALGLAGISAVLLGACTTTVVEGRATPAVEAGQQAPAGSRTGPELAEASADALERAGSVRLQGTVDIGGGEEADVDLRLRGSDLTGSFEVDGMTVGMVVAGGSFYMQAAADFWEYSGVPRSMAALLADRWVVVPAEAGVGLDEMTLASFADEVRAPSGATIEDEVTGGELDGHPVWVLEASDGSRMHVAVGEVPYPLLSASDAGSVRASEFGAVPPIQPPADFVDLGDLGDLGG